MAIMSIDDDRLLSEFFAREENRVFLKSLQGMSEEIRQKGEGLLKFEYAVVKERQKNMIVKEYLEGEISSL